VASFSAWRGRAPLAAAALANQIADQIADPIAYRRFRGRPQNIFAKFIGTALSATDGPS
jgi:hypothetical protein